MIEKGVSTLANYQEITNSNFDANHNVLDQRITTYTDQTKSTIVSCQEIRSSNFTPAGVAKNQTIVTYTDTSETDIIDVKVITNSGISSSGNIAKTVINKYSNATISNDIITPQGDPIDRQTIDNTSFDNRGDALSQTVFREVYSNGSFIFASYQSISNNIYDANLTHSEVKNYSDKGTTFVSLEVIDYSNYDAFGNAKNQVINSYTSQTAISANLIDSKKITNTYANPQAELRGNASSTTVTRYTTTLLSTR